MATEKVKLAEALLRRKELMHKVAQLHAIGREDCFEDVVSRVKVTDSIDNVTAKVAKVKMKDLTKEFDFYAGQLRVLDGHIQHSNWTTEIDIPAGSMKNFDE